MDIKILGPGCAKCHKLDQMVRETVDEMSISANIEYIKDMGKIMDYPILTTPGLVINEKVVCAGKVPSKKELTEMLSKAKAE